MPKIIVSVMAIVFFGISAQARIDLYTRASEEMKAVLDNKDVENELQMSPVKSIRSVSTGSFRVSSETCSVNVNLGYKTRLAAQIGDLSKANITVSKATCK